MVSCESWRVVRDDYLFVNIEKILRIWIWHNMEFSRDEGFFLARLRLPIIVEMALFFECLSRVS